MTNADLIKHLWTHKTQDHPSWSDEDLMIERGEGVYVWNSKGRRLFDEGDAPYHLKVAATEAFPTGVIRVIYVPTEAPAKVGYDEVKDQVPDGR